MSKILFIQCNKRIDYIHALGIELERNWLALKALKSENMNVVYCH